MPNILAVHVQSAWVSTAIIVLDNRSGRKDASNYFNTKFDGINTRFDDVNTQIGDPKADIARVKEKSTQAWRLVSSICKDLSATRSPCRITSSALKSVMVKARTAR